MRRINLKPECGAVANAELNVITARHVKAQAGKLTFRQSAIAETKTKKEKHTTMTTIEQFKEKQQRELLKFESEQTLRSELPEELRDKGLVSIHNDHASFMLHEHNGNRKLIKAVKLVRQFSDKLVESEHWKDGCISVRPAKINDTAKRENTVMDGAHAVEIKVEGGKGYGPSVDVKFWIQLEWGLVEMSVRVSDLWELIPRVHNTYYQGETVKSEITWPTESRCVDQFRKWWSSPGNYSGSYYLADLPNFEAWASHMIAPGTQPKENLMGV